MNTKSTDDTHSTQLTEPPNSHWPEVRRASASSASTTAKPFVQKHRNSRLRSTGCKTCRQRKIKCDEQKPVCKNCTKSHRTCLGYVNFDTFVFTHETGRSEQAVLESQMQDSLFDYGQPVASGDVSTQRRDSDLSMTSDDQQYIDSSWYGPTSHGDSESLPALDSMRDEAHASAPAGSSLQQSPALQFEAFFYERFINSVWLHSQADAWQFYLPLAMRNSPALYYSVMSLSALYMAKTGVEPRARRFALSLYQGTLSQLQKALYDPAKALQDETLMATVIIGLYELIDKPGHNSWASHSRGTAELMKMRGSSAVRTGIGKMLFLTLRGYEVVRAILQYQDTFVADEIWTIESSSGQTIRASNGLLRETAETKDSAMHASPDYAAVLFMLGGQVANLQALCARSANQADAQPDFAKSLLDQASSIESRLKHWHNSLPQDYNAPDFTMSVAPLSSDKMQNAHALTIGYQLCFYSAFLILLHRVVAKYIHHDLSRVNADVESLGRFIVMTARYLTQGQTTVSLNVTWPIYMASMSLSRQEEKSWSLEILRSISRDKGWAVATSALTAATAATHKSRLNGAAEGGTHALEHQH